MSRPDRRAILDEVAAYYGGKIAAFGPSARGVDWKGQASHDLRHRQFMRLLDDPQSSVLDLGCGYGDFYRFLRAAGHRGVFIGIDVSSSMIEAARRLHGEGPDRTWKVGSAATDAADYAIASGLLNVKGARSRETWEAYALEMCDGLAAAGRLGFGFNVLSLSSDPDRRRPDLFYADPGRFLDLCLARYSRCVALLQDYGLYEFTLLVRHPRQV